MIDAAKRTLMVAGNLPLGVSLARGLANRGHAIALAVEPTDRDELDQQLGSWDAPGRPLATCTGLRRAVADEFAEVKAQWGSIDALVVVPTLAPSIASLEQQTRDGLQMALDYGSWPLIGSLQATMRAFSRYPRYAIAISHDDLMRFDHDGAYRSVATSVLETFTRYMATHLRPHGVLVNALRMTSGAAIQTESSPDAAAHGTRAAAETIVALCSGLLDAMSGQVLTVDDGQGLRRGMGVTEVR